MSEISIHQQFIRRWVKDQTGIELVPGMDIERVWIAICAAIQASEAKKQGLPPKPRGKAKKKRA